MNRHFPVGLDHPRVIRPGLKDQFSASSPTGLQIDKGPNLVGPFMLGDKSVTSLKIKSIQQLQIIYEEKRVEVTMF